jgi:hypothetical protein
MHVPNRFSGIAQLAATTHGALLASLADHSDRPGVIMSEHESVSREEPPATSAVAVADARDEPEYGGQTGATGPGEAPGGASRGRRPWWRTRTLIRLAWLAGLIVAGIGLYLCYLHISRTEQVSSVREICR